MVVWVGLLGAAVGCARLESRVIPLGPRETGGVRAVGAVRIVRPPLTDTRAQELGLVELTGYDERALEDVPDALRQAARTVGADVVVWIRTDRGPGFVRVTAALVRSGRTYGD